MPFEQIFRGVCAVGGPGLTNIDDAFSYLIDFGNERVLIDAGTGGDATQLLANVTEAAPALSPLTLLILTHNHIDHAGGASDVRAKTGAKIAIHDGDASALETGDPERTAASWYGTKLEPMRIDVTLKGHGEPFRNGGGALAWFHTPGHTPGSISVLLERDGKKILFGQDIHGPFSPQFGSDVSKWRASMQRLLLLKPDILCEGHYGFFNTPERAEAFIRGYLDRV
jgi:glyoxylase-like metal-dependent hydrolase (beta-lactamase superfamily II)